MEQLYFIPVRLFAKYSVKKIPKAFVLVQALPFSANLVIFFVFVFLASLACKQYVPRGQRDEKFEGSQFSVKKEN